MATEAGEVIGPDGGNWVDDLNFLMDEGEEDGSTTPPKPDKAESSGEEAESDSGSTSSDESGGEKEEEDGEEGGEGAKDEKKEVEEVEEVEEEEDQPSERHPSLKGLKGKYPTIFKDFPELRPALQREREYDQIFLTPDLAKEAQGKAAAYDTLERTVLDGQPGALLAAVKDTDPKALTNWAARFLPALMEVDQTAYHAVTGNYIKNLLGEVLKFATFRKDQNLERSVGHISLHLFNTPKPPAPHEIVEEKKKTDEPDPAERAMADAGRIFQRSVTDDVMSTFNREIVRGLDPDKVLADWEKEGLVGVIKKDVVEKLKSDRHFIATMQRLWDEAKRKQYAGDDIRTEIKRAWLGRARKILPAIRSKRRAEKLEKITGRLAKSNGDGEQQTRQTGDSRVPQTGPKTNQSPKIPNSRDIDYRRTSDLDILNDKPTLKKR